MAKIDVDRFICFLIENKSDARQLLEVCLKAQGLEYKNGEIVEIDSIKAENYVCKKELRYNSGNGIIVHYEPGNKESLSNLKKRCRGITNDIIDEHFSLATEIDQPPLTEEQKPISQIQHAQAYVEKDLDLVGYANGVIPHKDEQGIDRSSCTSTKENNKPKTIKFNEPMTNAEKRYFDKILFDDVRYKPIDFDKVDIDKMVEEYKEEESKVLLPLGFSKGNIEHLSLAYKNGLEDMLKLIKGGGE